MAKRIMGPRFTGIETVVVSAMCSVCLVFVFLPPRLSAGNSTWLPTSTEHTGTPTSTKQEKAAEWTSQNATEIGSGYVDNKTQIPEDFDREDERLLADPSSQPDDIVSKFLTYLAKIEDNRNNCKAGTWDVVLDKGATSYGPNRYMKQAMKTVETANFFTRIWRSKSLEGVQHNEEFFFNVVASNVENDNDIFAFGNCYDAYEFLDYNIFCPYAYRLPDGGIRVKDLSQAYPYLTNESEWFYEARKNVDRLLNKRRVINTTFTHRYNETAEKPPEHGDVMLVTYEDGHWSAPYYDCGGGNIWMITYTVPFLGSFENGSYYFKSAPPCTGVDNDQVTSVIRMMIAAFQGGTIRHDSLSWDITQQPERPDSCTSGLDIDLRAIDINQCPEDVDEDKSHPKEKNIFAGSDKCHNDSQVCVFIPDQGFRRGSYRCVCRKGFYFPNPDELGDNYYNGTAIEAEYDRLNAGESNSYHEMVCKPCGPGCDECVDGRSCRYAHNWTARTVLLILQCVTMGCTFPLFLFTISNRDVKVVKAASPVLLRIILLGSLLLYCPVLVSYYEPTVVTCMLLQWFKEVGFAVLFGALLLKTWRISVVFRVRSAARVRITDVDLIKRLGLIVFVSVFYLTVRSVIAPPEVETGISLANLKAEQCSYNWWDYAANIAELVLLLWGVRLCYVVRKAPSEFNESRFISWAIYNETMLSLFLCVATFFLQDLANPDLLYIIWFLYGQLTTTVVLALLFGSKIYLVSQGKGDKTDSRIKTATTPFRQRTWDNSLSSQGLMAKTSSSEMEKPLNQRDIEDELKRLYTQLEQLKTRNMVVGNPHLTRKLTEMAEVARETELMLIDSDVPNSLNGVHEISYSCNNNGRTSSSQADWI